VQEQRNGSLAEDTDVAVFEGFRRIKKEYDRKEKRKVSEVHRGEKG
jgi:hypothetical protein